MSTTGELAVTIPADTSIGTHRIAAWSEDALLGWTAIEIVSDSEPAPAEPAPGGESDEEPPVAGEEGGDELPATGGGLTTGAVLLSLLLTGTGAALLFVRRAMAQHA